MMAIPVVTWLQLGVVIIVQKKHFLGNDLNYLSTHISMFLGYSHSHSHLLHPCVVDIQQIDDSLHAMAYLRHCALSKKINVQLGSTIIRPMIVQQIHRKKTFTVHQTCFPKKRK